MRRFILGVSVVAAVVAATLLTGCTDPPGAGATGEVQRFVVVDGRKVDGPDRVEVRVGATVQLEVTSDVADELHVHGYDEALGLPPRAPATLRFRADIPGAFEVELHGSGPLTELTVRP
jgi:hypothetical protein